MKYLSEHNFNFPFLNRRKFIKNTVTTAGAVLAAPLIGKASSGPVKQGDNYTVRQIMDSFISGVPGGPLSDTVDTLKAGRPDTIVKGIVTSMFPTIAVIRKTIDLGANFIIVHEPTFYSHTDNVLWLNGDPVYNYKEDLLNQHEIAIWRNHDYIHRVVPDGVTSAVLAQLDWKKYSDPTVINLITLAPVTLKDLIGYTKQKLNIEMVRYIGNPEQSCSRVLFIPGAAGGQTQVGAIRKLKPDVLICGEISEWETAEYVRDAVAMGENISLIVLGHIASEEAGSQYMLNWLAKNFPSIKATHLNCGNSLSFL